VAGHIAVISAGLSPALRPIGTIALVAADLLVVSMATSASAMANSHVWPLTTCPSVWPIAASLAATNVLASQLTPNSAIAPAIPAVNVDCR